MMNTLYFLCTLFPFLAFALLTVWFPLFGAFLVFFLSTQDILVIQILDRSFPLVEPAMFAYVSGSIVQWVRYPRSLSPRMPRFLLFGISVLFSVLFCIHPLEGLFAAIRFLLYPATAFFIGESFRKKDHPQLFIFCLLFFTISIFQIKANPLGEGYLIQGFFHDDPHYFALFLSLLFPFVLSFSLTAGNQWQELSSVLLSYLLIAAVLFIDSPIGSFLFCIGFVLSLVLGLWQKKHLQFLLPLLVIALFWWRVLGQAILDAIPRWWASFFHGQPFLESALLDLRVWAQHPLLGVGYCQLTPYLHWVVPNGPDTILSEHASLYLLLAETGLWGGMTFLWLLLVPLHNFLRHGTPKSEETWIHRAALISSSILVLSSLVLPIHVYGATWCFLGILYGLQHDTIDGVNISESGIGDEHEYH